MTYVEVDISDFDFIRTETINLGFIQSSSPRWNPVSHLFHRGLLDKRKMPSVPSVPSVANISVYDRVQENDLEKGTGIMGIRLQMPFNISNWHNIRIIRLAQIMPNKLSGNIFTGSRIR